jgi:hypothetical protein
MKTGDRVVIVLLDLLLTDGTLPHADADARMVSREILMVLSVALMRLPPLSHEMNEINVSWVPRLLATLLVLCTNLLALFQNQERKTVRIYTKYHVTDPSHDTNMHTSSKARLRSSRSAIVSIRIWVESLERLIEVYTGEQVNDDVRSKKMSISSQQLFVRTL